MSTEVDNEITVSPMKGCTEWTSTDLAVTGKLGVGVGCPWSPAYPTAYVHGTMQVKDRTDVGQLGFLINSQPPTYPIVSGSKGVASQLDLTGSLRIVGPPSTAPVDGAARLVVIGQADASGRDLVPLQLWQNSKGEVLNIIDAAGKLGIGTGQPTVPLDVAGHTRITGSLSIGGDTYSSSLTIRGTFAHQITGAFSGQANVNSVDGATAGLRVGDRFKITAGGHFILTTGQTDIFVVQTIAPDFKSFTVADPPDANFKAGEIFVDQAPLDISSGSGALLLSIDRYGSVKMSGGLEVAGDVAVGGVLKGTGIVKEAQIAEGSVTLAKLGIGSVGNVQIIDGSVTGPKLSSGSVGTLQIADGSVTNSKLAADSVGSNQIANNSVTSAKLSANSVGTGQIGDGAVTLSKLGAGSVGTGQIADGSVTSAKIAGSAVGTNQLADKAVTAAKLVTIAQSGAGYYDVSSPGWKLNSGSGNRTSKYAITFPKPFASTPQLIISLTGLDADCKSYSRLKVYPGAISATSFEVVFETWDKSLVHGAGMSWAAFLPT